jgi:hypothetical protein
MTTITIRSSMRVKADEKVRKRVFREIILKPNLLK